MTLGEAATVRTGAVTGRKKVEEGMSASFHYKMLNLKCVLAEGYLDLNYLEDYPAREKFKPDVLTRKNDVLIRLSFPYTSVLINEDEMCNLLVPSHFAILRTDF